MRICETLLVLASLIPFASGLSGQTPEVRGTVQDGTGLPINGALVTVKNGRGAPLDETVSDVNGKYKARAAHGTGSVSCEIKAPDIVYKPNPDVEPYTITSGPSTVVDCTLYQARSDLMYWDSVMRRAQQQAVKSGSPDAYTSEWQRIEASGLPPAAKAAAAQQFKPMAGKIRGSTFHDYVNLDAKTLDRAVQGDANALDTLPPSVKLDVKRSKTRESHTLAAGAGDGGLTEEIRDAKRK